MDILKDIKSGALPVREIPHFVLYLLRRSLWLVIVVIISAMILK